METIQSLNAKRSFSSFFKKPSGNSLVDSHVTTAATSVESDRKEDKSSDCPPRPLTDHQRTPSQVPTEVDKDTLLFMVHDIQRRIEERAAMPISHRYRAEDQVLMERFQQKFNQSKDNWMKLIKKISGVMGHLDKHYKSQNYFGLKNKLRSHLENILLSYIVIGAQTTHGTGIDNRSQSHYRSYQKPFFRENLNLEEKVERFLSLLLEKLELISKLYSSLKILENMYLLYLSQNEKLNSTINALKEKINENKDESNKISDHGIDGEVHNQSDYNSQLISKLNDQINENLLKINKALNNKYDTQCSMDIVLGSIFDVIDFNYFLHEDYCGPLDYELFS